MEVLENCGGVAVRLSLSGRHDTAAIRLVQLYSLKRINCYFFPSGGDIVVRRRGSMAHACNPGTFINCPRIPAREQQLLAARTDTSAPLVAALSSWKEA